jgi:hypothetical protein
MIEEHHFDTLMPMIEIAWLGVLCLSVLLRALLAPKASGDRSRKRWECISYTFWTVIPILRRFSALQLLYYVTPGVIKMEGYLVLLHVKQRMAASREHSILVYLWPMMQFVLMRVAALVVGFDAFLVKFRFAAPAFLASSTAKMHWSDTLRAAAFFFQILGVVDIKRLVRERLFIFIFGGANGDMDIDEEALASVWKAAISKQIYEHFGVVRGTVVMLGFDDYDFQRLALIDDEEDIRQSLQEREETPRNDRVRSHCTVATHRRSTSDSPQMTRRENKVSAINSIELGQIMKL